MSARRSETALERIVAALEAHGSALRAMGNRTMAQCPAHADRNPSLSLTGIEGQVLVHCFAGCRTDDVLAALGMTTPDLFDDRRGVSYHYDDGRIVSRTPGKRFRQSGHTKGIVQLYRLSRVAAAVRAGESVYLVEGEKDVHALEVYGVTATTAPQGANNFDKADVSPLRGADVVAVVDQDAPGERWAAEVVRRLQGFASSVTLVRPATGKDAADHVAAGHSLGELVPFTLEPDDDPDGITAPGDDLFEGVVDELGFPYEPTPADVEWSEAVEKTRAQMGGESPDADAEEYIRRNYASVDWVAAFATDFSQIDWMPGRFMERGQQVTLVGDGKVGKSLFMLDWAWRSAAGRSFLGDDRHPPMRVLYFDRENSLRDIVTRAISLGARPEDLANLIYKPFPLFPGPLDASEKAARDLLALIDYYQADIVVIDTVSRFIAGKENDSDTWLQLYQRIHAPMKAKGVSCLRLDHFGKDAERGSRGSSAKSQDVDGVWELSAARSEKTGTDIETLTTTLKLNRTHTRSGLGEDLFVMVRRGERQRGGMWLPGRTRHELTDGGVVAEIQREIDQIVQALIDGGCPVAGRDTVKKWMRTHGMATPGDKTMADVIKEFKARSV
jgi:5S rRNA maturation endonuclease (ribonuclease M5)